MNRSFGTLCIAALALVACKKDDQAVKTTSQGEVNVSPPADSADARGHSLVRVVNAVNGGKDAVVEMDNQTIFDGVKAATVTDYREVKTNLANFTVKEMGGTEGLKVAENDEVLMDGNRYTVILMSEDVAKNALRVVKDEVIPDSGKARIRVIHAAPGAPELDIAISGSKDKLFSGVNFKSEAGYKDVDPTTLTLVVTPQDEKRVLLRIPNVALKAGTATTVVITGANKLSSFKFTDTPMGPTTQK